MRVVLKGIHNVKAKVADGSIVTYCYAWRGGPRINAPPGSSEFMRVYNQAIANRNTPPEGLLFTLISEFKASSEYISKSKYTKRAYATYLRLIETEFGDLPIAALEQRPSEVCSKHGAMAWP